MILLIEKNFNKSLFPKLVDEEVILVNDRHVITTRVATIISESNRKFLINRKTRKEKFKVGYFYIKYIDISERVLNDFSESFLNFKFDISKKIRKITKEHNSLFSMTPKNNIYYVIGVTFEDKENLNKILRHLNLIENLFKNY